MKRLNTILFAVTFTACSAANAMADENVFQAPDVSIELGQKVQAKMDALAKETYGHRGYFQIIEYTPEGKIILETAVMETRAHDVEENRS